MTDAERARALLAAARRIVSFSGAGLSAESGVPTFRDAVTGGLWSKHDLLQLASPEGFAADPNLVIQWYVARRRSIAHSQPNAAHIALARRADIVHVTQNVDDLLQRAGACDVIQLHGSIIEDRCNRNCGYLARIDLNGEETPRSCPNCGDRLRPNVVWFGEYLPAEAWQRAERACAECEIMLVIGTSAVVYPAAGLIHLARTGGAKIIVINTQPSDASGLVDIELIGRAGEIVPQLLRPIAAKHGSTCATDQC